jgi:hypothetical protein
MRWISPAKKESRSNIEKKKDNQRGDSKTRKRSEAEMREGWWTCDFVPVTGTHRRSFAYRTFL